MGWRDRLAAEKPAAKTANNAERAADDREAEAFGTFGTFGIAAEGDTVPGEPDAAIDEDEAAMRAIRSIALPLVGSPERAAMDRKQAELVAGLLKAARGAPPR
jgi:hypothetical protein